ncbi:hypothetical protein VTN77DRAFT_6682 [Rasamsonia byssochlamydoides]|uniref:uncharacterized protein n=1 Tax=Rasamsonia byssochlamydoides TaxID=89139 RepID=UPI003743CBF0
MPEEPINERSNGTINGTPTSLRIPIVDFSAWKKTDDKAARLQVAKEIVNACREVGFVYIVNHALPDSLLDEAFDWSRRFFALSQEDKLKAPHPKGWAVHRGYSWPGLEKVSQAISEGNDEERVKKLREITDCKVSSSLYFQNVTICRRLEVYYTNYIRLGRGIRDYSLSLSHLTSARRVMTLAVTRTKISPTNGSPTRSCQVSEPL